MGRDKFFWYIVGGACFVIDIFMGLLFAGLIFFLENKFSCAIGDLCFYFVNLFTLIVLNYLIFSQIFEELKD